MGLDYITKKNNVKTTVGPGSWFPLGSIPGLNRGVLGVRRQLQKEFGDNAPFFRNQPDFVFFNSAIEGVAVRRCAHGA